MIDGKVALLVMDLQEGIVAMSKSAPTLLANVARALDKARSSNILVVHVHVAFRVGYPEIGTANDLLLPLKEHNLFRNEPAHPAVPPLGDEIIIVKRRVNAFHGTDLETILRANRIESLVMCGFATSGVVLSTVRDASDRDYRISVLKDCCDDMNRAVHEILMSSVFPAQAKVMSAKQFSDGLSSRLADPSAAAG